MKRTWLASVLTATGVASAVMIAGLPKTAPPVSRSIVNSVTSFAGDHPEWALLREARRDVSGLKFSHKWHLELSEEKGGPMACVDCHEIDSAGRYMEAITFDQHCARCHGTGGVSDWLTSAEVRGADWIEAAPIPHGSVADAWRLITAQHGAAVALNPKQFEPANATGDAASGGAEAESGAATGRQSGRRRPVRRGGPRPPEVAVPRFGDATAAQDWILEQSRNRLREVLLSGCRTCHTIEDVEEPEAGGPAARIASVDVPTVWMTRSVFSHQAHAMMSCEACHDATSASTSASDILIPGIDSCRECHTPRAGAPSSCVTCHLYHERPATQAQGWLTTSDLVEGASAGPEEAPDEAISE